MSWPGGVGLRLTVALQRCRAGPSSGSEWKARYRGWRAACCGRTVDLLDTKFLLASLLWGSVGVGYFIYGRKQEALLPMIAGVVMIAVSYLLSSWFWMSLLCLALMIAIYLLAKRGY